VLFDDLNKSTAFKGNIASEHLAITRNEGVTTTLTRPTGGVIAGQGAIINLAGWTPELMKVRDTFGLQVNFPEGTRGFGAFRAFLPAEFEQQIRDQEKEQAQKLKDYFEKAKRYQTARTKSLRKFTTSKAISHDMMAVAITTHV